MNKRIIALLTAIITISLFSLSTFASVDTVKLYTEYKVTGNTVELTFYIEGTGSVSAIDSHIGFDNLDVTPATVGGVAITAAVTTLTPGTHYTNLRTGDLHTNWTPGGRINITSKYIETSFTDMTTGPSYQNKITLTGNKVLLSKFYFNKIGTVDSGTFTLYTSGTRMSLITDSGIGYCNANPTANVTLKADTFVIKEATSEAKTVTYATTDSTGGSAPTQVATAPAGTFAVAGAGSLVRTGYTLTGWNDGSANYAIGDTYTMPSANVTFTPVWTINKYTVTFKDWDGTTLKTQANVDYLTAATAPTATRDGYTFSGWSAAFNSVTADITVTAQYTINAITTIDPVAPISKATDKVDVQVKDNNGDTVTVNAVVVAVYGFVPATVTEENMYKKGINESGIKFGVKFGGQYFQSLSTWAGFKGNGGKYIIKLVDPSGKLNGTYPALNYTYDGTTYVESGSTSVTIGN